MVDKVKSFELVLKSYPYKILILDKDDRVLNSFEFKSEAEAKEALASMWKEFLEIKGIK